MLDLLSDWRGRIIVSAGAASTRTFASETATLFAVAVRPTPRWLVGRSLVAGLALAVIGLTVAGPAPAAGEGADGHMSQRRSSHFLLLQDVDIDRYSGRFGSREFERDVLEVLEAAHDEVGRVLRVRPLRQVRVLIFDPAAFDARFAPMFRFRAAGFYDGVIHVRGDTRVDARLVRTLYHEYVHAALDAAAGPVLPGWLNEGIAEWFEQRAVGKRYLSPGEHAVLSDAARRGELVSLAALDAPGFGHMGQADASLAYLYSYAAVEHMARRHGERSLERVVEQLLRTRNLDRALERAVGLEQGELEARLLAELR
jgi:hypothetical protein